MLSLTSPKNIFGKELLSGSSLKLIAVVSMLIDHTAAAILYRAVLLPNQPIIQGSTLYRILQLYKAMRFVGRIAFPIFCFLLVEGFIYTSNRTKYALRLFLFALLSEIPFDLALKTSFTSEYQNVFFTLLIGFLVIWGIEHFKNTYYLHAALILAGMGLAYLMKTDYSYRGVLLIVALYYLRMMPALMTLTGCALLYWEPPAMLAFLPINLYNHKRGLPWKYFFYLFYPVHLSVLYLIRILCF